MADEVTLPEPPEPPEPPPPQPQPEPQLPEPQPTTVESDAAQVQEPRTRRRRVLLAVGWGVLAVMLVAVVLAGLDIAMGNGGSGQSLRARPGDCFSGNSDSDLKRVPCDDSAVKWTVIGVVEHKTQQESKQKACEAWPNAEASYWETRNGTDGFVLCLGSVAAS
ncbi:MAG: hypothetical protein JWP76_1732 [Dactylosporangium sp.]|nr:hypothetical protein [Dactylosporangium sp.]